MIISASRRTDIPAYYSEWFFQRIRAGYALVRNPMNARQISRRSLRPDDVDGIVFWTKNPSPMLDRLELLKDYTYYFQFTLNAYGQDVEVAVPSKNDVILPAFQKLSALIGSERVIWRYDPIFLSEKYTFEYHLRYFEKLAKRLSPYTKKCTISFLDFYRNTAKRTSALALRDINCELQNVLAKNLAEIAHGYGLKIDACAESATLQQYGIERAHCIDAQLFSSLLGRPLKLSKDKSQRAECGCAESFDIGAYSTCPGGCLYCYANRSAKAVNFSKHDPTSPLLADKLD